MATKSDQEYLTDWRSYPLKIQPPGRPILLKAVKEHFERTKAYLLITIDDDMTPWRKTWAERNIKTIWFDRITNRDNDSLGFTRDVADKVPKEIKNNHKLEEHLGITGASNPIKDPTHRFIILQSSAPVSPRLKITEELLLKILTYHQVSPHFLNFVSHICQEGQTSGATKIPFSGFQRIGSFFKSLSLASAGQNLALGRSGHYYELVFELKVVCDLGKIVKTAPQPNRSEKTEEKGAGLRRRWRRDGASTQTAAVNDSAPSVEDFKLWPVVQSVIYHRFDLVHGNSLWILTAGDDAKAPKSCPFRDFDEIKGSLTSLGISQDSHFVGQCFTSNLYALVHLSDWSHSDFDSYINLLYDKMQALTLQHIDSQKDWEEISEKTLKTLHQYMETLGECIEALKSNLRVCQSIAELYTGEFSKKKKASRFPWMQSKDNKAYHAMIQDMKGFHVAMKSSCDTIEELIRRAERVKDIGIKREDTIYRMLQNRDTHSSAKLAEVTTLFSVITLILLPISIMSSIFSTDIIKFNGNEGGEGSATFAGNWSGPAAFWFLILSAAATGIVMLFAWRLVGNLGGMMSSAKSKSKLKSGSGSKRPSVRERVVGGIFEGVDWMISSVHAGRDKMAEVLGSFPLGRKQHEGLEDEDVEDQAGLGSGDIPTPSSPVEEKKGRASVTVLRRHSEI
ncbi:hypothetical protein QBC38DRAFT_136169 [Podospora fimiseda]|uniref:CorA-like transporter domain-containing protein n=1 Tax=Podospora fimiseda TaxID=252190 RepID=A0AAN7GX35_9PEZI|nr:hypothetical protein QBC38DRAFT_136169 [Podospora fimiseda]